MMFIRWPFVLFSIPPSLCSSPFELSLSTLISTSHSRYTSTSKSASAKDKLQMAKEKADLGPIQGTLTNLRIPVPGKPIQLAGILQSNGQPTRRLGIICHGVLGHKNYLFQPLLANLLAPHMDTFRYDSRGNGESDGQMGYSNWDDDYEDIDTVVNHFERQGYQIYALIGHSRGAISILNYAACSNHVPLIPHIVSISTRFDMADVRRRHGKHIVNMLEEEGYFDWVARAAGKDVSIRVTKKNFDDFIEFNTAAVVNIPPMTNILLCHGSEDAVVPVKDVATLHAHLSHANTTVRIITNADHNYRDHTKEISQAVAQYFSTEGRKEDWTRRIMPNWRSWVGAVGGVLNFRTVGDTWIPSLNDGTVKYLRPGVIYRCADISRPTEEGIRVLESLNITDVFDLRSTMETERRPTFQTSKIRRHHTPVFSDEDYSPVNIAARFSKYLEGAEGFAEAYMSMIPFVNQFFRPVLDHIVQKRTPFIVHCTAGKDRTGVVCALLQMICGVDEEMITWEYELTHKCLAIKEEDIVLLKAVFGDETSDERVRGMMSAKAEYMARFLEKFHAKYGTIHDFLVNEMQLNKEQIQQIHDALVATIPLPRPAL